MWSRLAACGLVWCLMIGTLPAQEGVRVSDIVRLILAEYEREVANNAPPATRQEAAQKRDKRLTELLVEGNKERKPQHGALAIVCMHLRRFAEAAEHCEAALQDRDNMNKEEVHYVLVQALASDKHLQKAEQRLNEALEKFPASQRIPELHNDLYRAYLQLRQPGKAAEHVIALLEHDWPGITANPQRIDYFLRNVDQLVNALRQDKQTERALTEVERLRARAERATQEGLVTMASAQGGLLEKKVRLLAELKRTDEAFAILRPMIETSARHAAANPKVIPAALQHVNLVQLKYLIQDQNDAPDASQARDEYLSLVNQYWNHQPQSLPLAEAWLTSRAIVIRSQIRTGDFAGAEKLLAELTERQKQVGEDPALAVIVARFTSSARTLTNNLAAERNRAALIGQAYKPFTGATWINGSPLSEGDLKGKVILLDFWAVWCGPCIATFPHLRDWQEKYANRGLVIVGITKHYEFDFDGLTGSPRHVSGIAPGDEDAATVKFLAHHRLKHVVAVMPDDELSKAYSVTGIPQAVLIDRSGTIRVIRVGSGEANAAALEAAIEKYLAETAQPAAAQ
ncbi:MAG: redoxin domain-containing protein [Planctomycetaceae bacterium]|nr:redoxin domain-containing protein [Planctomycetaceae bacterium]